MNRTIKQFCQSLTITCGFTDTESEVYTNAAMTDILGMTVESSQVLDVFHAREEVMHDKKWLCLRKVWLWAKLIMISSDDGYKSWTQFSSIAGFPSFPDLIMSSWSR